MPEEEEYVPMNNSENCGVRAAFEETQGKTTEMDKQNEQFTQIVTTYREYYQKKSSSNLTYKKIFFYAILAMLGTIVLAFVATGIVLTLRGAAWQDTLPILGGGLVTLLTSLIILPQIIATHLFPVGEDQTLIDLIAALRGTGPK